MEIKDKPIPAKIFLNVTKYKSSGREFIGLAYSLYLRNLIFKEPRELRKKGTQLELTVIFRDLDSFKNWTSNEYINKYWSKKFDNLLIGKPKTIKEKNVIIEIDKTFNCSCDKSYFYILEGRALQFCDELTCNKCLGQVPYSKVAVDIKLEDWQTKHQRVYLNWLESGLFEKESYQELTNYKKGILNIEGEKIRSQLSKYFKIPVYISYFVEEPDVNFNCVVCGDNGIDSGLKSPNRICKKCNTIFGYNY